MVMVVLANTENIQEVEVMLVLFGLTVVV